MFKPTKEGPGKVQVWDVGVDNNEKPISHCLIALGE